MFYFLLYLQLTLYELRREVLVHYLSCTLNCDISTAQNLVTSCQHNIQNRSFTYLKKVMEILQDCFGISNEKVSKTLVLSYYSLSKLK